MKRIIMLFVALAASTLMFAQSEVLKFLGIPIDGPKSSMIEALKAKGFEYLKVDGNDVLIGDFNGRKSNIYIHTNRNVVDRVYVCYNTNVSESQIKIDYNNLISQFQRSEKYFELIPNVPLSDEEDISYEMSVHNKNYDAVFCLKPVFTDEEKQMIQDANEGKVSNEDYLKVAEMIQSKIIGNVWFRIQEHYGEYGIEIYYDNLLNRADGEDL